MLKIIKNSTLVPTPIVDLKLDSEPRQGSTDPVTSEGVKSAIDGAVGDASAALQQQIDEIAEKAGSGYISKGEASVATLNALSGQENGELYTMTDAGTLTDGSLAVVAGDTVAWDATNEVWYKAMDYAPSQYGTNEVHNLPTSITAFRTGDVIPVDGPNGTAKMSKDDLLNLTSQNALSWSVATAFNSTASYKQNELVIYNGRLYKFKYNKSAGAWDASLVEGVHISAYISELNQLKDIGYTIRTGGYWGTDGNYHVDPTKNYKNTLLIDCAEGDVFTYQGKGNSTIASVLFFNGNVFVSSAYYDAIEEPVDVTIPNGVNVVRFGSFANAPSDAELVVAKHRTEDAELLGLIRKNAKDIDDLENHKITKEDVASSFTEDESKFVIDTNFTSVTPHYTNYVALRFNTSGAGAKTIRIKGKFSIAGGLDAGAYYIKLFDGYLNRLETLILQNTSGSNDVDFTYQQYTFPTAQVYLGIQVGDIPVESIIENLELYDGATLVPFSGVYQFSEHCEGTFSSEQITKYGFATNDKVQTAKKGYTPDLIHFQVEANQNFADVEDDTAVLQDSESFAPVNCVLKLPTNYTPSGKPTKLIMFAHGAGSLITGNEVSYWNPIVQPLWDNGYAVFDVNGSNNNYTTYADNMGSPRTISAYRKALQYIVENYNVEDKIYLMGVSMGGLVALNFVQQYPELVNVIGLMNPITAMYKAAWLHPWYGVDANWPNGRTHTMIAREFNFDDQSGATYEADKVQGYDPLLNHSVVVGANRHNFLPCSIKIWHGENDTTALEENIVELVTALKNAGINAVLRNMAGVGHNTTQVMYEEIAMWFNRF